MKNARLLTGISTPLLAVLFLLFSTGTLRAQLTVNTSVTAAQLVSNLVGQGLTVSNISLNCPNGDFGTFANGNTTNLGLTNGIILATGDASVAIGPNNSASAGTCAGTSFSDPQLVALEPQATYDPCILEFDIVPACSQLTISFVFGSEEYPEFVNSSYNDAFGFFISGPGPACQSGYYNNTNIATLPNNTQVSIDNVNNSTNSAYYVDNTNGTTIQYDGFTTVLTRNVQLCPCQTYHFKLAIADAHDCIYDSGVFIDFLQCTTVLTATTSSIPTSGCSGCNGSATVTASGTNGPFTYSWSPGGYTTSTVNNLCAGTYTVTYDDAVSCTPPQTVTVTVAAGGGGLTVAATQTDITCFGGCNGAANVNVTGGSPPITYNWAPAPGGGQGSPNATGLCAGTYTCTMTDNTGCTATQSFTITQPTALAATSTSTPSSCGNPNGSVTVNPSGGAGGYTYLWTPGNYTTATVSSLNAGTYNVTVTDANGCTTTSSVTIANSSAIAATNSVTDVLCNGGTTGSATVTVTGNNGSVNYTWAPNVSSAATASNLGAGTYVVTATDATGCSVNTTVTITEPTAMSATTSSTVSTCGNANGSVDIVASGGAGGYTYLWTPGNYTTATVGSLNAGMYNVTVTDANGCTYASSATVGSSNALNSTTSQTDILCFGQSTGVATINVTGANGNVTYTWSPNVSATNSATNIPAGTYVVDATDATGCTSTETITITEPPQLTINAGGFNVTCNAACDGQVVVLPSGGTPNYSFAWNTGCTSPNCNNVCAGSYTVTVTDANGCAATATTSVTEPPAITINTTTTDAHCNQPDGAASANGAGGTGTLTYSWLPSGSGQNLNNIPAGNYSVIVTDANGCDDTAAVVVNNINGVTAPPATVTDASCFGASDGSATVNASGGTGTLTYTWSPAPASSSTTNSASGLPAGNYQVVIADQAGCSYTVTATINEPQQLTLSAVASPPAVCEGQSVQLSATPGGGTPGYNVTWTPGGPGASINIIPPATGTYTADVVDQNGCTATANVNVTVNGIPTAALSGDLLSGCAPLCVNFSDLSTVLAPSTVSQWSWDFGDGNVSTLQNPSHCYTTPGVYSVTLTVSTGNGCTNTITMTNYINVFVNPLAAFTVSPQPTTILNSQLYFTDASTNAVSWNWNFGDVLNSSATTQNASFVYPEATCYQVTLSVESQDGCVDTAEQIVCIDPDVAIYVPNTFTPNDDGLNEIFQPVCIGIDPDHYQLWVFDRWGNQIFYTDDLNTGWNGIVQGGQYLAQIDTYVWKIKAVDVLGKKHNLIGHVNLIR